MDESQGAACAASVLVEHNDDDDDDVHEKAETPDPLWSE